MMVATHSEDLAIERLAARCLRALITDVEQGRCIPEFGTALNSKIRLYGTARLEREVFLSAEESVTDSFGFWAFKVRPWAQLDRDQQVLLLRTAAVSLEREDL